MWSGGCKEDYFSCAFCRVPLCEGIIGDWATLPSQHFFLGKETSFSLRKHLPLIAGDDNCLATCISQ